MHASLASLRLSPAIAGWIVLVVFVYPGVPLRFTPGSMLTPTPQAHQPRNQFMNNPSQRSNDFALSGNALTRTPYDDVKYLEALRKKGSPLLAFAAAKAKTA
jgi:hypothetical protein